MKIIPSIVHTPGVHPLPAILVHDLRTPLSQIIGYSEMLIEQVEDDAAGDLVPHLEKIRSAGYRLLDLMNNNFQPIPTPVLEKLTTLLKQPASAS